MNRLAVRNLFRHRIRSLVTLSAIAFSTVVLVLAAGFIEWIFSDLRKVTIETGLGHIQVMRHGYLERGISDPYHYLIPRDSAAAAAIASTPHVVSTGSRLNFSGLISFADATLSFVGVGLEPEQERTVSRNLSFKAGRDLAAADTATVVVGEGLAANLGLKLDDRVTLLVNTSSGSVSAVEAVVRGIYSTQVKAVDEVALRIPLSLARKLLRVDGSHLWVLGLDDVSQVDATAEALKAKLDAKQFDVVRWIELSDFFTKTMTFLSGQLGVMRVLIGVIIVLGVSNMLIMNVLERTGEIGTLMALGVRRRRIVSLFLLESLYLAVIGGVIGILLALALAHLISAIGVPMPPPPGRTTGYLGAIRVTGPILLSAFAATLGTTLLAALYPARKASRLVVVDALRFNR